MNAKEKAGIMERVTDLITRHANDSIKLMRFDCPQCGHKTLAGDEMVKVRHDPPLKPHIPIMAVLMHAPPLTDEEGYLLDWVDTKVCYTCGNNFKEVQEKKWVKVE